MKRAVRFAVATFMLVCGSTPMLQGQAISEGTWSGTRIRISGRANNPQPQRVSLEVTKVPDPHSAWRPDNRQVVTATLVAPGGRLQVSDLSLENGRLSFSYRQEVEVVCQLERQPDDTYQGDCVGDGAPRQFRMTLSPPKGPA